MQTVKKHRPGSRSYVCGFKHDGLRITNGIDGEIRIIFASYMANTTTTECMLGVLDVGINRKSDARWRRAENRLGDGIERRVLSYD